MSSWMNQDEVRKMLFDISDYSYENSEGNDTFTPAPPKSIAEYKARTSKVKNPGLFDNDFDCEETVFISGRGTNQRYRMITPGQPVELRIEDDLEIQRKIRQVSGEGYRNEIIEMEFGHKSDSEYDDETVDSSIPDLRLRSVSECPSATSTSKLSTQFQKCNITGMSYQNNENSNQTESYNSPRQKKEQNYNSRAICSSTNNLDGTEFLKPGKKKSKDQLDLKNQSTENTADIIRQKVKNKLHSMAETESPSTEESSQRESSSSTTSRTKSKKKKKFKKFMFDNSVESTSVPVWSTIRSEPWFSIPPRSLPHTEVLRYHPHNSISCSSKVELTDHWG